MLSEEEVKRGKALLDEFYKERDSLEGKPDAERAKSFKWMAENFVDYITDIIYNE